MILNMGPAEYNVADAVFSPNDTLSLALEKSVAGPLFPPAFLAGRPNSPIVYAIVIGRITMATLPLFSHHSHSLATYRGDRKNTRPRRFPAFLKKRFIHGFPNPLQQRPQSVVIPPKESATDAGRVKCRKSVLKRNVATGRMLLARRRSACRRPVPTVRCGRPHR